MTPATALAKLNQAANAMGRDRVSQYHIETIVKAFAENGWKPLVLEMSDKDLDGLVKAGICSCRVQYNAYSERYTYAWKGPKLKLDAVMAWTSKPGPRAPKLRDQLELLASRDRLKAERIRIGDKSVFFLGVQPDPEYPSEKDVWVIEWATGQFLAAGDSPEDALFQARVKGLLR